jgi:hypothetical protein
VGRGQFVHIETLAAGGFPAIEFVPVPCRHPFLDKALVVFFYNQGLDMDGEIARAGAIAG